MVVFALVLFSYFLVTGGIIYDVIVEPPSIGSTTDEFGRSKPVAFMQYRVNGQYIMEGLASRYVYTTAVRWRQSPDSHVFPPCSFMFGLGGVGFIVLERSNAAHHSRLNRTMLFAFAFFAIIASFLACRIFMTMKLP